jgi:glycosyltransferase involved in cell wall biosynthesis
LSKSGLNKKILFVSSFSPPLNAGSGRNAYNFAKFISDKGAKVTLLSLNRKGKLKPKDEDENLKIIRLRYFNQNLLTRIISLIIILPGYFFLVIKNDIIFVYGGNIIAFEFILLFGRLLGKMVVFRSTMNGEDDIETLVNQRWIGKFNLFCLKQVDYYFSINPAFSRSWKLVFGSTDKIFESTQGVDTGRFIPAESNYKFQLRKKLNLPEDTFIIISVGYVVERKGFRDIFKSLTLLDFSFLYLVVGDFQVPDDHYLKNLNHEMKELTELGNLLLKEKVVFIGSKMNVDEYLKASDILILNSIREGFPNVVLEAMACGLPVIYREIKGIDGFFTKNGQNILINSGNDVELTENVRKLYFDSVFREKIGKEAGRVIKEQASFEVLWNNLKTRLEIQCE